MGGREREDGHGGGGKIREDRLGKALGGGSAGRAGVVLEHFRDEGGKEDDEEDDEERSAGEEGGRRGSRLLVRPMDRGKVLGDPVDSVGLWGRAWRLG